MADDTQFPVSLAWPYPTKQGIDGGGGTVHGDAVGIWAGPHITAL
jgi:hypothetical protein